MTTRVLFTVAALLLAPMGCTQFPEGTDSTPTNVVELTAKGLVLDGPDEIPAGWTTFRLTNESEMAHFAILERLPDGIGIDDLQKDVAPVFQDGMDLLNDGAADAAMATFGALPSWFGDIVFMGGPGLIAPARTAQTTVHLKPGTYVLECYVKTNGIFHSYNPSPDKYGMVKEITVTADSSHAPAPKADLEITLSSTRGMEISGAPGPGEHTVAVHFADQTAHEHFLGHDVHLVHLEDQTDLKALATWMDWTEPRGLETRAPATFLGGVHEMPAGETGYFTVTFEPGQRYAWIAEVPKPDEKGMLTPFTVSAE